MRLFLLRVLFSWWIIALVWLLLYPMIYLMTGETEKCTEDCKEISREMWYGM